MVLNMVDDTDNTDTLIAGAGAAFIDGYRVGYLDWDDTTDPPTVRLRLPDFPPDVPDGSIVEVPVGGEVTIGRSVWIVQEIWVNPDYYDRTPDGMPIMGGNPGTVTLVRKLPPGSPGLPPRAEMDTYTLIAGAGAAFIDGYRVAYFGGDRTADPPTVRLALPDFPPDVPDGSIVEVPVGGEVTIGESVWIVKEIWVNPDYRSRTPDAMLIMGGNPGTVTLVRKY
jgi:hypothetical protein